MHLYRRKISPDIVIGRATSLRTSLLPPTSQQSSYTFSQVGKVVRLIHASLTRHVERDLAACVFHQDGTPSIHQSGGIHRGPLPRPSFHHQLGPSRPPSPPPLPPPNTRPPTTPAPPLPMREGLQRPPTASVLNSTNSEDPPRPHRPPLCSTNAGGSHRRPPPLPSFHHRGSLKSPITFSLCAGATEGSRRPPPPPPLPLPTQRSRLLSFCTPHCLPGHLAIRPSNGQVAVHFFLLCIHLLFDWLLN